MDRIRMGPHARGKLVHRVVSAEQAEVLHQAIANYRRLKKLLRGWESERSDSSMPQSPTP